MPIYEYECPKCGKFEEYQEIDEDEIKSCPECNLPVKKVLSVPFGNVKYNNAKEHYEKVIKPEAKDIAKKIKNGDENAAADFFGSK